MADTQTSEDIVYCTVHPTIETTLRCNKCGRPMCTRCAERTPVGYRCKECVKGQQKTFYTAKNTDILIQFGVAFGLSIVATIIVGLFGGFLGGFILFFIMIPVCTAAGAMIADLAHRAAGKRRHRYGWLAVAAGIVTGALVVAVAPILLLIPFYLQYDPANEPLGTPFWWSFVGMFTNIGWWVYVVAATLAAVGNLRMSGGRIRFR